MAVCHEMSQLENQVGRQIQRLASMSVDTELTTWLQWNVLCIESLRKWSKGFPAYLTQREQENLSTNAKLLR